MDLTQMMADDAAEVKLPTNKELQTVQDLVTEMVQLEAYIKESEEYLAALKKKHEIIQTGKLPEALEAFGLTEFVMVDGSRVKVKDEVYAGITEGNKDAAFSWLKETGNDGIIKNEVKLPFGKGQDREAQVLMDLLTTQGYSFNSLKTVHAMTLKAFVKDRLSRGESVPVDLFSVHIKRVAKFEKPKEK